MNSTAFYDDYYTSVDERAWAWRELSGQAKANNVAHIMRGRPVESILDIGCGTGSVLAHLAHLGLGTQYWAVDITEQSIQMISARTDIPNLCSAAVFDGLHLPYHTAQFDLAILSHVIEHIHDPAPLIIEAARVARWVIIEVPLEDNLYTTIKVNLLKSKYREEIGHIQCFSAHETVALLQDHCHLHVEDAEMVYVPDNLYFFRKGKRARMSVQTMLSLRKVTRAMSSQLYAKLVTDHFICLACRT